MAVPLLAASLTRDPVLVAVVAACAQLPWLLLSLHAGALIDRVDRRRLIVAVDLLRAGVVGALAGAAALGVASIPLLAITSVVWGAGDVIYANTAITLVPVLTGGRHLAEANGRLTAGEVVTNQFAGQPLGGVLFALAAGLPFVVDSLTFLASALLLASLAGSFRPVRTGRQSVSADIAEGVRWLWRHRMLRSLSGLLAWWNFWSSAAFAVFVLFALEELGLGAGEYGLLLLGGAVGGLVGGLTCARLSRRLGPGVALAGCVVFGGLATLGIAAASSPWVVAALLAVEGMQVAIWNVLTVSIRQEIVPDAILGRVSSAYRVLGVGAAPLGALAGGLIAGGLGLRAMFLIGGIAVLLSVIPVVRVAGNRQIAAARAAVQPATSTG